MTLKQRAWSDRLKRASGGKLRRRAWAVMANALNSLAVPLLGPLFSFMVIRLASLDLWGEFVRLLIVAQLAAHIAGWGNKDFLLREFSRRPGGLGRAWQSNLLTRLALLGLLPLVLGLLGQPAGRIAWLGLVSLALMLDQAYDVLVLYRRDFIFALWVEVVGLAALALPIVALGRALTLEQLLAVFALSNLGKTALLAWRLRGEVLAGRQGRFDTAQLRGAFPFFVLGFSGLLQSRADLYSVGALLDERAVGQYQVFSSLMLYAQSAAGFVLLPFVKDLYRLSYRTSLRLSGRLFAAGLIVAALFAPLASMTLSRFYHFDLPVLMYAAGALCVWPIFLYLPIIYALFKAERQAWVIAANGLGILTSLALNLALLPRLGLAGAAVASAAAQWGMALAYLLCSRALAAGAQVKHADLVSELPRDA